MTTWIEAELGRWGKAAIVLMALAIVLSSGACKGSMALEESSVEDEMAALVAEVGPDWDVVEAYLERERTWMARILASGKVSEDDSSPSVGEAAGATPRIFVVRASGDGAPPRAEMEQALRAALETENGADVEQRLGAVLGDLNGAELVDPRSEDEDSPASSVVNETLRAALDAQIRAESVDLRSEDEDSPESTDGSAPDAPDVRRAAAAAIGILEVGGTHEKTVEAGEFLINSAAMKPGGEEYASRGARALLEYTPDYEGWGLMLQRMHLLGGGRAGQGRRGGCLLRGAGFRGRGSGAAWRWALLRRGRTDAVRERSRDVRGGSRSRTSKRRRPGNRLERWHRGREAAR